MPDEARPVTAAQPDRPAVAPATPGKGRPGPVGESRAHESADGEAQASPAAVPPKDTTPEAD
uniref:hypothetical protein n=1 Tax=Streptomyces sp. SM5 TaxID=402233 RepID=UPI001CA47900